MEGSACLMAERWSESRLPRPPVIPPGGKGEESPAAAGWGGSPAPRWSPRTLEELVNTGHTWRSQPPAPRSQTPAWVGEVGGAEGVELVVGHPAHVLCALSRVPPRALTELPVHTLAVSVLSPLPGQLPCLPG